MDLQITRGITFLPITITVSDADGVLDLTGWSAFSDAKSGRGGSVTTFSFNPEITDATAGVITIPEMTPAETAALTEGRYFWDLVLENTDDQRLGPYLSGTVTITSTYTETP